MHDISQRVSLELCRRIRANGKHNAFTGLGYLDGTYYLAFREGDGHANTDGDQAILASADTEHWCEAFRYHRPPSSHRCFDFRDSYLLSDGDRLLLYACVGVHADLQPDGLGWRDAVRVFTQAQALTCNGTWGEPQIICDNAVLWKPIRFGDRYLCLAYGEASVVLMESPDGFTWTAGPVVGPGSESVLYPDNDGSLIAIVRTEVAPYHLAVYRRAAPDAAWERVATIPKIIQCPEVFQRQGVWYLLGRERPDYLELADPQRPSFTRHRLKLWRITAPGEFEELLVLPSAGDCAYAGTVVEPDGSVLVSYYSQHDTQFADAWSDAASADLYLARLHWA